MSKIQYRLRALTAAAMLATANLAGAQEAPAAAVAGEENLKQRVLAWLLSPSGITAIGVFVVLVGLLVVIVMLSRRAGKQTEDFYSEPEEASESSKFEQLMAEIQGLSLRVQGGESRGYYRKIEQLTRIYMEKIGFTGARQMGEDELLSVLNSGSVPQKQAAVLSSIFERCRQGAEHESHKLDFTAAELLKDLRQLVKQAEETPTSASS